MTNIQRQAMLNQQLMELYNQSFRRLQQQTPNGSVATFGSISRGTPHPDDVRRDVLSSPAGRALMQAMQGGGGGQQYMTMPAGGGGGGLDLAALMQLAAPQQRQQGGVDQYGRTLPGSFDPNTGYRYPDPLELEFQRKMDEANAANEARYNEARQGYGDLRTRVMDRIGDLGSYQRDDANRAFNEKSESVKADLASRGLLGSTVLGSVQRGVERERNDALRRVEDDIANRQVSADERLTGNLLGLVERRNDVGPNYDQLIQLRQALGAGGYAGSGGYGTMPMQGQPMTGNARPPMTAGGFNPGMARQMAPQPGGAPMGQGGMAFNQRQPWMAPNTGFTGNAKDRFQQYTKPGSGYGTPMGYGNMTPGTQSSARTSYPTPQLPPNPIPPQTPGYGAPPMGYPMPQPRPNTGVASLGAKSKVQNMATQALQRALQPQQQVRVPIGGGGGGGVPATYLPGGGVPFNPNEFRPQFFIPAMAGGMVPNIFFGGGGGGGGNYQANPGMQQQPGQNMGSMRRPDENGWRGVPFMYPNQTTRTPRQNPFGGAPMVGMEKNTGFYGMQGRMYFNGKPVTSAMARDFDQRNESSWRDPVVDGWRDIRKKYPNLYYGD